MPETLKNETLPTITGPVLPGTFMAIKWKKHDWKCVILCLDSGGLFVWKRKLLWQINGQSKVYFGPIMF